MNKHTILTTDMLKRVDRFLQDHPIDRPMPRLTAVHAEVVTIVTALDHAAEAQLSGTHHSEGGADLRETAARELRAYLKDVCRTGRALDDDHPGIRPIFRLPESGSYPALLTAARSIIAAATPLAASFIETGLPATFLTELQALIAAFQAASDQKYSGRTSRTLNTAALKEKAKAGIAAARKLDVYVRNHFRGQPEILAAWTSARHIQRPPKRQKRPTSTSLAAALAPPVGSEPPFVTSDRSPDAKESPAVRESDRAERSAHSYASTSPGLPAAAQKPSIARVTLLDTQESLQPRCVGEAT